MNLDLNDVRIAVTVASLVLFVALMAHTYSRARRSEHERAAQLPFDGEPAEAIKQQGERP